MALAKCFEVFHWKVSNISSQYKQQALNRLFQTPAALAVENQSVDTIADIIDIIGALWNRSTGKLTGWRVMKEQLMPFESSMMT